MNILGALAVLVVFCALVALPVSWALYRMEQASKDAAEDIRFP